LFQAIAAFPQNPFSAACDGRLANHARRYRMQKDRERKQLRYIGPQPKGEAEIPVHGIKPPVQFSSICEDENQLPWVGLFISVRRPWHT
jgi:hypothetical protein